MATSQNGYPASANRAAIGVKTFAVPGFPRVLLPVRADIAPLLLEMARWFFANVEAPLMPGCWGYAYRSVRGSTGLSNHASGTAIDLNAPRHPLGAVGTVPLSKRKAISQKAANLGLRWGGDYTGRKDEMHFEVIVGLATAKLYVAHLQGTVPPTTPPTKPPPTGRPTLQQGSTGEAVKSLQRTLNRWYPKLKPLIVDGQFGPATRARVIYFQQRARLTADGIVGAKSWAALGFK